MKKFKKIPKKVLKKSYIKFDYSNHLLKSKYCFKVNIELVYAGRIILQIKRVFLFSNLLVECAWLF